MIQPGLGFFASVAARRGQALIDCSGRLPFRIFLQQPRGIKSGLVVPEEFTLFIWASRSWGILQDFVKRLERAGAVVFLFKTQSLFEQGLVSPIVGLVLVRRQLIVNFDGPLVIFASSHLKKNVALAAKRFAF